MRRFFVWVGGDPTDMAPHRGAPSVAPGKSYPNHYPHPIGVLRR